LRGFSFGGVRAEELHLRRLPEVQKGRELAEAMASTNTLFGYMSARNKLLDRFRYFTACFNDYREQFRKHHLAELARCLAHKQQPKSFLRNVFNAAGDDYESRKDALEKEMAIIQGMNLPDGCQPPRRPPSQESRDPAKWDQVRAMVKNGEREQASKMARSLMQIDLDEATAYIDEWSGLR